ncbi:hypothetical protein OG331_22985 [Streptomyces sp. NBC_01017]|uniref:DUF6907 domain-containing protein n=1 Tax=Streptomyces sp. NBC_01017 TaxID=2903721 RepID=UPI003870ECDB|nr:hypothetical protein OG331_22985 [Streptomyces sp. NBC_01017]
MSSERYWRRERPEMPVYGPTDPFGDEEHEPDVIVRVDFLMSREQITTALGIAWAEGFTTGAPESLTVLQVRHEVEAYLSVQAFHELDVQMERDRQREFPPEQQRVLQLLAEAVERAYPAAGAQNYAPAVQAPRYGDGTVTLQTLDHGEITIDEPRWCTGHDGEQIVQRVDVTHVGRKVAAEVETDAGAVEFLPACISWGPFAELRPEPYPLADVDDFPAMDPAQLRELAAETALHAGRLYRLSNELDRLRRNAS